MDIKETLGKRIKFLRNKIGISQEELADTTTANWRVCSFTYFIFNDKFCLDKLAYNKLWQGDFE